MTFRDTANQTYVVAGNGTSLSHVGESLILASDKIVRTNNFFFEPQTYLGSRVDLVVMGGDPRVAPFMVETLWRCRSTYDVRAWTSRHPKIIRAGNRRFASNFVPFPEIAIELEQRVKKLVEQYGCKPMTGTNAVLAAWGLGARRIILTGYDFYQSGKRNTYDVGPHQSALLGADLNNREIDTQQHNINLDLAIFQTIQQFGACTLLRASSGTALDAEMDLATKRSGPEPIIRKTVPPKDWAPHAGLYPLAALKMMRIVRSVLK